MEYGLIGEKLGHSFSGLIHEKLAGYPYMLCPLEKNELDGFLRRKEFRGINVTIPYKRDVIPYCDELDESAKRIGVVNTIVNRGGRLIGYNTDFDGFLYSIRSHGVQMRDKKVIILGSGGTRHTITAVAEHLGAREILVASRTPDKHQGAGQPVISYADCEHHFDAEIIINATPKGMYPHNGEQGVDLSIFTACEAVFDVILQSHEEPPSPAGRGNGDPGGQRAGNARGTGQICGGKISWFPHPGRGALPRSAGHPPGCVQYFVYRDAKLRQTLTGQALARYIDKEFVDTDAVIVERAGMPIKEIF